MNAAKSTRLHPFIAVYIFAGPSDRSIKPLYIFAKQRYFFTKQLTEQRL